MALLFLQWEANATGYTFVACVINIVNRIKVYYLFMYNKSTHIAYISGQKHNRIEQFSLRTHDYTVAN